MCKSRTLLTPVARGRAIVVVASPWIIRTELLAKRCGSESSRKDMLSSIGSSSIWPYRRILMPIRCRLLEADREEMARRFYQLRGVEAIEATYQQKLKGLEDENKSDATTIARLQEERDQAKAGAEKAAAELARNQPGQGSEMYQETERLFLDGKIEAAVALLDDDKLRRSAEQAEKALTDFIQGWRLKANLCKLKFRFEEAEKAYETALRYINRKTQAQLWAETEVDLGITHDELGTQVEGRRGNEHLAAAITAYQSALKVYTRKQLAQDWAGTENNLGAALRDQAQNNLGNALWHQASRTKGTKGAELMTQAASAYQSALEVYQRKLFPRTMSKRRNN
jgi:tetratricopeptide (TPR) repeat protein